LLGCAHNEPVVVERVVVKAAPVEQPSADLLACAERPQGFSPDAWAKIPPEVRMVLVNAFTAFGANAARQDRLVNWHVPDSCPGAAK